MSSVFYETGKERWAFVDNDRKRKRFKTEEEARAAQATYERRSAGPTPEPEGPIPAGAAEPLFPTAKEHGQLTQAEVAHADRCLDEHVAHSRVAGHRLIEARDRGCQLWGITFEVYLSDHAKIGHTRAYELIAIAEGRKTVEEIRGDWRERQEKHRDSVVNFRDVTDTVQADEPAEEPQEMPEKLTRGGRPPKVPLSELDKVRQAIMKHVRKCDDLATLMEILGRFDAPPQLKMAA